MKTHTQPNIQNSLDKSAQLRNGSGAVGLDTRLKKRARKQALSFAIKLKMIDANPDSPLKNHYEKSLSCSRTITVEGGHVHTHYCNSRICIVCNSIRTAKLMDAYLPTIEKWKDKYLLTLTVQNVDACMLENRVRDMGKVWRQIMDVIRKRKRAGKIDVDYAGLRKLEITHNEKKDNYHPHYHILVNSKEIAELILNEWLKRWRAISKNIISRKAQDLREADNNAIKELFKYFTKIINNKNVNAKALDIIMQALYNKRIYNAFGGLHKIKVNEDVEELDAVNYDEINDIIEATGMSDLTFIYHYELKDWVEIHTGLFLTNYTPSDTLLKLIQKINSG